MPQKILQIPSFADGLPTSADFVVTVNGLPLLVHETGAGAFALFAFEGKVQVEITSANDFAEAKIRPLSRGVVPEVNGRTIRFALDRPAKLSVELDDRIRRPLFLFADSIEEPKATGEVIRFEGGKVHDVGRLTLKDGQTMLIECGAVVRGAVFAENASNIRVVGRGILDGREFSKHQHRMIQPIACRGVHIEGITIVGSPSWTVCPYGCDGVTIRNVKIVNWRDNDDGIDIVGCQRVRIDDCFVRTKDDCIAIKATAYHHSEAGMRDVADVVVERSVFWNAEWGNALEIGFETRCDSIRDITFRDCDVIRCEREGYYSGGVFTIHNGDRAVISNVRYEDIRVEDAREKLIDFKVLHSHYSKDATRGQIRDVVVRDVHVVDGALPPSVIQSFDREHRVENVAIENLRHRGVPICTQIDARAVIERAIGVKFS